MSKLPLLTLSLFLLGWTLSSADFREFQDRRGRPLIAEIQSKTDTTVTLKRQDNGKRITVGITTFRWEDQEFIRDWVYEEPSAKAGEGDEETTDPGTPLDGNRLYPRTREEIKQGMAEIKARPRPADVTRDEWETTTILNQYRFLSGVPSEVQSDPELHQKADLAAKACTEAGHIAHDLGDHTDKCNLAGGGGMIASVKQYMDDNGDNNRVARGHRRWCLNPPMGKVGFGGDKTGFSAMWCMDHSGKAKNDFWAYPGEGLYPEEFLGGNSWSAYFDEDAPEKDKVRVRVFKLRIRPDKKPINLDELDGRELEIPYIATSGNSVNFEVNYHRGKKKGIYWVSIKGGGLSEGYLVEIY